MRIRKLILIVFFLFCLNIILAPICLIFASEESYPIPNDAILKLEKTVPMGPSSMIVRSYSTMLNKEQIQNFFRKELLKAGWEEKFKSGLAFVKGDKIVCVMVLAGKPRPSDKKTYFTVVYSNKISDEMMQASAKDKPDKLNFMPIYPNAKQAVLWDNANGVMASYTTDDPINDVVAFFKNKMPAYGWVIFQDKPVTEKVADCPNCQKKIKSLNDSKVDVSQFKGKFYTADLKYRRLDSQFCSMSFTSSDYGGVSISKEAKAAGYLPLSTSKTQITVSYRDTKNVK